MFDLNQIKDPSFLSDLSNDELYVLAEEIRSFIIDKVSEHGGHLSGNLGIVDLTIAINKYFSHGEKFIYDVGHQMYTHKILTGRASQFNHLREMDGLSGFSSPAESPYDVWEVGHASTSLAAQAGLIENGVPCVSIIGDGALTGGEALEGLEYLSTLNKKAIIIINDNGFSISKNVGFINKMLDELRSTRNYSNISSKHRASKSGFWDFIERIKRSIKGFFYPPSVFESFGFKYYGPIDGHNYKEMFKYFKYADNQNRPTIIHVITKKGKGYKLAEDDKIGKWHSVPSFDKTTGEFIKVENNEVSFSHAASTYLISFYEKYKDLKVVMPAMTFSSSMNNLQSILGANYFDTGITEQFAASFAASLSINSPYVFLPIYSTFLQRAYDQVHQDICLQNLHVVLGVDKSGLVGEDGKTHQGIYNISYLKTIPNLKICAPKDYKDLFELMDYAFLKCQSPIAICYPKTFIKEEANLKAGESHINESWISITKKNNPSAFLITYSNLVDYISKEIEDLNVEIINARFINPIDKDVLLKIVSKDRPIIVYEEAVKENSLGAAIISFLNEQKINKNITEFGYPLDYIESGSIEEIRIKYGMDKKSIRNEIKKII
ncbi:MAG: 1-deoxy-D-xylulose-5-phosphate synthase [Bacillales bacterium]|nr:1-deoxy-D-xylulose-5-phosphate synthase [Bacillales bacterium]